MSVQHNRVSCIIILLTLFSIILSAHADSLTIKAHIPWSNWVTDFEFAFDGMFITPYDPWYICYFTLDDSYNLHHQYTMSPYGGDGFTLNQQYLYTIFGSYFLSHEVSDSNFQFLNSLALTGSTSYFDPIIFLDSIVICHFYPGDYYRINISNPAMPVVSGKYLNTNDVCHDIITYQDTLLISSRQVGMSGSGNIRILRNNVPDTLISLGVFGDRPSYTAGIAKIDSVLFTAHYSGLVVYNISNPTSIYEIYFFATAWARDIVTVNNHIFMSCNNGWHVFKYTNPDSIQHVQHLVNDNRALWMKLRLDRQELWSYVDGGNLAGFVIFDISSFMTCNETKSSTVCNGTILQIYPNPFRSTANISFPFLQDENLSIFIYNAQGQLIKKILPHTQHTNKSIAIWDGKDTNGHPVSSGVYILLLKTADFEATAQMILLK